MRGRRGDSGFTMIEILVVIVILGLLTAVVVLAVSEFGDRGADAARRSDEKTLRTAQEAYYANQPVSARVYAVEAGLVAAKLLADESTLHDICLSADKTEYKVVPAATDCTTITF